MQKVVAFTHTVHGWRCSGVWNAPIHGTRVRMGLVNQRKTLLIGGNLQEVPRRGQFCLRPHRLLERRA